MTTITPTYSTPIKAYCFPDSGELPLVLEMEQQGTNLANWLRDNQTIISQQLSRNGAILFRGFDVQQPDDFQNAIAAMGVPTMDYVFRSTPRKQVEGKVLTSTEYPANEEIVMHNEHAYSDKFPEYLWFYCHIPAPQGGETPLADSRKVLKSLDDTVRQKFEDKGLLYVRNYWTNLDLSWQDVFQTDNRADVEQFCQDNHIELEWFDDSHIQTRHQAQVVLQHPVSGEKVWLNQSHLFHASNLKPEVRDVLLDSFGEENLPRNVYFADHTPIADQDLDHIRQTFRANKVKFKWQKGDVLLVDNILVSHGREPYEGDRKIMVAMTGHHH